MTNNITSLKSIAEVAKELSVEPYVIRYWETQFRQINPLRRGGKRFYNKTTVETIKNIKQLLYDRGYTIKGAQAYLCGSSNDDDNQKTRDIVEKLQVLREFLAKFVQSGQQQ